MYGDIKLCSIRMRGCLFYGHYKIFCVNGNTGFRNESRIFYFKIFLGLT